MTEAGRKTPLTVKFLAWVFASSSLLYIIEDITPLKLYGLIKKWSDAYALLVEKVFWPIFGWIKFDPIEIEPSEEHALVLCIIIGSAAGRASYYYEDRGDENSSFVIHTLIVTSGFVFFSLVFLLLAPSDVSLSFVLPPMGVLFLQFLLQGDTELMLEPEDFRREILAVLAGLLVLVLANYAIFGP